MEHPDRRITYATVYSFDRRLFFRAQWRYGRFIRVILDRPTLHSHRVLLGRTSLKDYGKDAPSSQVLSSLIGSPPAFAGWVSFGGLTKIALESHYPITRVSTVTAGTDGAIPRSPNLSSIVGRLYALITGEGSHLGAGYTAYSVVTVT
jgi:hypothetical protein